MKQYLATATSVTTYSLLIEANSPEEASEVAENTDGGDFSSNDDGDWEISSVIEEID